MNIKEFYRFGSKLLSTTVQAHMDRPKGFLSIAPDERRLMDEDRLMQGTYNDFIFPVVFKQEYGKKLQDMLDTGTASLYLISDKMKTVLEDNNLTGWQTFAVKVLTKKEEEIEGYHGLSITGRCGKIDYSKSEIIEKRLVPTGPLAKFHKGLHVGLDKWDGSDFFLPEKYFGTIVTSRAADVLKKSKLTNIRLENLADIEIDAFTVQVAIENQNSL
jgi:hypothetical protein